MYIYIKELEETEEIGIFQKVPQGAKKLVWNMMKKINVIIVKQIEENRKIYLIPNIEQKNTTKRIRKKLER